MQVTNPGMNFIYFSGCACGLKERRWGTASVMNCRLHETLSPSIFNHLGASRVWKSSLIEFSHPSYCTFMPLCHWLITWQQHRAFRHVNMVRMSSWGLERASDVKRKRGFKSISGCFLVAGFLECFTSFCWSNCLLPLISRVFRKSSQQNKISNDGLHSPLSNSSQRGYIGCRSQRDTTIS